MTLTNDEIVWLDAPWSCYAVVIHRGAYYSLVEIPGQGRVMVEPDDFEEWSERAFEFESEE